MCILNDEDAILKWVVSGSFLLEMIKSNAYKDSSTNNFVLHHKSAILFEQKFLQHCELHIESFQKLGKT